MPGVYTNTWHRSLNLEIQVDLGDKNEGASLSALLTAFGSTHQKWSSRFSDNEILKWGVNKPNPYWAKLISIWKFNGWLWPLATTASNDRRRRPPAMTAGDDRRQWPPAFKSWCWKWKIGGEPQCAAYCLWDNIKLLVFRNKKLK